MKDLEKENTDKKDDERLSNLLFYKIYATDEEIEEMFSDPWTWIIIISILLMLAGVLIYKAHAQWLSCAFFIQKNQR